MKNAIIENLKCDIFGDFVHCAMVCTVLENHRKCLVSQLFDQKLQKFQKSFFGFLTAKILIILAILSQISFCFAHGEKKMRLFLGLVSCPNCIPYFSMQNMTRTELHSTYFPAVVRIIASQLLSLFHLLELPILLMF